MLIWWIELVFPTGSNNQPGSGGVHLHGRSSKFTSQTLSFLWCIFYLIWSLWIIILSELFPGSLRHFTDVFTRGLQEKFWSDCLRLSVPTYRTCRTSRTFQINIQTVWHLEEIRGSLFFVRNVSLLVSQVTVVCSFVFPSLPPRPLNVFFAVCILLTCGSTLVLVTNTAKRTNTRWHVGVTAAWLCLYERGLVSLCLSDILVPTGRPGAEVQEPDLLHAGVHRAAVSMCQPLLPRRQVNTETRRTKGGHGSNRRTHRWKDKPWKKHGTKLKLSLANLSELPAKTLQERMDGSKWIETVSLVPDRPQTHELRVEDKASDEKVCLHSQRHHPSHLQVWYDGEIYTQPLKEKSTSVKRFLIHSVSFTTIFTSLKNYPGAKKFWWRLQTLRETQQSIWTRFRRDKHQRIQYSPCSFLNDLNSIRTFRENTGHERWQTFSRQRNNRNNDPRLPLSPNWGTHYLPQG